MCCLEKKGNNKENMQRPVKQESSPVVNYSGCPMVSDVMWLSPTEYFPQNNQDALDLAGHRNQSGSQSVATI